MPSKDDTREREELVNNIKRMSLDKKLEDLILELIDESKINDFLREIISKILHLYADILDAEAKILVYEVKMETEFREKFEGKDFEFIDPKKNDVEWLKRAKKLLMDEVNKRIIEFKVKANKTQTD